MNYDEDKQRFTLSDNGIVVIPQEYIFDQSHQAI